jgi:Flp pilus assembly protein CpaB
MMKPTARRGPSVLAATMLAVAALLMGTVLTIGTLWALGVELPFLSRRAAAPQPSGFPLPVLAQPLPAYTKVKLEHFIDPKTRDFTVRHVSSKEEAEKLGFILDKKEILNRVLTRDKAAGYPFVDNDLYPKDTRAGLVAGIPAGKRAFVLAADKVQGIHGLKLGDRFDLLASVPIDLDKAFAKLKLVGTPDPAQAFGKGARVRVLVQHGAIVLPVAIREIPTGAPSKTGKTPTKVVQEATIAVDPDEVAPLHEALAIQATLMCVARSGRTEEESMKTLTPGSPPPPPMHAMEVISGAKRQTLVFPVVGKGPQELAPEPMPPAAPSVPDESKK